MNSKRGVFSVRLNPPRPSYDQENAQYGNQQCGRHDGCYLNQAAKLNSDIISLHLNSIRCIRYFHDSYIFSL